MFLLFFAFVYTFVFVGSVYEIMTAALKFVDVVVAGFYLLSNCTTWSRCLSVGFFFVIIAGMRQMPTTSQTSVPREGEKRVCDSSSFRERQRSLKLLCF